MSVTVPGPLEPANEQSARWSTLNQCYVQDVLNPVHLELCLFDKATAEPRLTLTPSQAGSSTAPQYKRMDQDDWALMYLLSRRLLGGKDKYISLTTLR